jgi:hypothetical protein
LKATATSIRDLFLFDWCCCENFGLVTCTTNDHDERVA